MTDHKQKAVESLQSVLDISEKFAGEYVSAATAEAVKAGMALTVAAAQVHATLYLAEQQRIANLIAYAGFRVSTESDGEIGIQSDTVIDLLRKAGEGLGIDE